ncbi:MAG: hypothetical protein ABIJ27_06865 [Candidatus Omnitrophota bacterium]
MEKKAPKNNSKNKDMITEIKEEFKRHTGVLMEQMREEVKTAAEGHSAIVLKLDGVDNRLSKIESNSFKNEMNIESIKSKAGTIDTKVDRIERDLNTVKNAVLDMRKTTKDHEKRVEKLEEKVHA